MQIAIRPAKYGQALRPLQDDQAVPAKAGECGRFFHNEPGFFNLVLYVYYNLTGQI
jgi:hypothetical protein